jgi:hypothetical protein
MESILDGILDGIESILGGIDGILDGIIDGIIASVIVTLGWVLFFRPRFNITNEGIKGGKFRIKLINKQCFFSAINLKIEICKITKDGETTKHFEIDREEFLLLKHGKDRIFKATIESKDEQEIKANEADIRVHVDAAHSFSGFGKEYERIYQYDSKTGQFNKV